jgi:hypothetical protein
MYPTTRPITVVPGGLIGAKSTAPEDGDSLYDVLDVSRVFGCSLRG